MDFMHRSHRPVTIPQRAKRRRGFKQECEKPWPVSGRRCEQRINSFGHALNRDAVGPGS